MDEWWDFTDKELELIDLNELRTAHERALAELHPAEDAAGLDGEVLDGGPASRAHTAAERQAVEHARRAKERYDRIRVAYDKRRGF